MMDYIVLVGFACLFVAIAVGIVVIVIKSEDRY